MANGQGGRRPGAGRKMGSINVRSVKKANDLIEKAQADRGEDNAPTPLQYLLREMWNKKNPKEVRMSCAVHCLPYISPKLANVAVEDKTPRLVVEFIDFRQQPQASGALQQQMPGQVVAAPTGSNRLITSTIVEAEVNESSSTDAITYDYYEPAVKPR